MPTSKPRQKKKRPSRLKPKPRKYHARLLLRRDVALEELAHGGLYFDPRALTEGGQDFAVKRLGVEAVVLGFASRDERYVAGVEISPSSRAPGHLHEFVVGERAVHVLRHLSEDDALCGQVHPEGEGVGSHDDVQNMFIKRDFVTAYKQTIRS